MKFSVIIPARTLNDHLKENITYLKKIRYYDFEVIIVLDEFVKVNFGPKETRFRVVDSGPVGPAQKRNVGSRVASGDVLAFLDDDAYPQPNWLRCAANIFLENPDLYALGGPALTPPTASFMEKMSGYLLESYLTGGSTIYRYKIAKRKEIDDYPSVNLFVKKEAFDSIGGFDVNYWPGEDTKLCLDLLKKYNKKFLYDPSPIVYHHRRELFKPLLQQIARYGRHRGYFARKFPKNSRKFQYFVPALFVLGLVFGLILSFIIPKLWMVYSAVLFLYVILAFAEAQKVTIEQKDFSAFKFMFFGILLTNLYYGTNFISGLLFKPDTKLRPVDEQSSNYIGG